MKTMKTIKPTLNKGQTVTCQWGGWGEQKQGVVIGFVPKNTAATELFPECEGKLKGLYDNSSKDRYLVKLDSGKYSLPYAKALEKRNASVDETIEERDRNMTQELRMLLKVSVHAIKSPVGNHWNASFMDKGYKATGSTPFQAIRNYLTWVEERLESNDTDETLASDFGIGVEWIDSLRDVLEKGCDRK